MTTILTAYLVTSAIWFIVALVKVFDPNYNFIIYNKRVYKIWKRLLCAFVLSLFWVVVLLNLEIEK